MAAGAPRAVAAFVLAGFASLLQLALPLYALHVFESAIPAASLQTLALLALAAAGAGAAARLPSSRRATASCCGPACGSTTRWGPHILAERRAARRSVRRDREQCGLRSPLSRGH